MKARVFGTRRLTVLAFLTALSAIVSLVESMLPSLPVAPGAKLGLGNIAPLFALILLSPADAFAVMLLKCLLGAAITGNVSALMYSIPAGLASLAVEVALIKLFIGRMSVTGVSLVGAVVFNVVQLGVACLVTGVDLSALIPVLIVAGALAGGFTGLLTLYIIKKLPLSVFGVKRICTSFPKE